MTLIWTLIAAMWWSGCALSWWVCGWRGALVWLVGSLYGVTSWIVTDNRTGYD